MVKAAKFVRRGPALGLAVLALALRLGPVVASPVVEPERTVPRAQVRHATVDLGVVRVGTASQVEFEVENVGGGALEIQSAQPGCDCAIVDFDASIAPGDVGQVRVRLDTTGLLGPVTKGVVLRTNDPDRQRILLTLKAEVVASVAVLPHREIHLFSRSGEPYVGRVLMRKESAASGELVVSDVTSSVAWLTAEVERLREPRPRGGGLPAGRVDDWLLTVHYRNDQPVYGRRRGQIHLQTGLADQPELTLDVESNLRAPVEFSTGKLDLVSGGDGRARGALFVSVREGLDPEALRVEASPAGLAAVLRPSTERLFKVEVEWTGGSLRHGWLTFTAGVESMRIPVEWKAP